MPTLTVGICNCLIGGEGIDRSLADRWATGIRFDLDGYRMELRQRREAFGPGRKELKGHAAHTSDLVISDLLPDDFGTGYGIARDLCALLSLATMSQVMPFRHEFGGITTSGDPKGTTILFRPPLETNDGSLIREYLLETWNRYRALKNARQLPAVINYLVLAELPTQPLEVKLLLVFSALECLRSTYCKERSLSRGTLRERVAQMLSAVGVGTVSSEMKSIVDLRNEIVHEGLSTRGFDEQWTSYARCQALLQAYLLRTLNFSGEYDDYSAYD